jgi:hypothetical protein
MEITRDLLVAERASLVAQRDEAARRAQTADGALQLIDALLARLTTPAAPAAVSRRSVSATVVRARRRAMAEPAHTPVDMEKFGHMLEAPKA